MSADRCDIDIVFARCSKLLDAVHYNKAIARNTVQTILSRLEDKGWLKHREQGRTHFYLASLPRTKSLGARVAQMVDRLFTGSADSMVTALLEHHDLSDDEAGRIRDMIEQAELKQSSRKWWARC